MTPTRPQVRQGRSHRRGVAWLAAAVLTVAAGGCHPAGEPAEETQTAPEDPASMSATTSMAPTRAGRSDGPAAGACRYRSPVRLARLADARITESSGLAASRRRPGVFWTHNDSGDGPFLYAIDSAGRTRGRYKLKGAKARDWEDMCAFRLDGRAYLLVADVGDNQRRRRNLALYLVEEPLLPDASGDPAAGELPVAAEVRFRLSDGPRDCEAVAVDVQGRRIVLLSKEPLASLRRAGIYELPLPPGPWTGGEQPGREGPASRGSAVSQAEAVSTARRVGSIGIVAPTGLDIDPTGRLAVAVTYGQGWCWRRQGRSWAETLSGPGRPLPMPSLKQGESVCFGSEKPDVYLTSEQRPTPLMRLVARIPAPGDGR